MDAVTVALYCRISEDSEDYQLGVKAQERRCRAVAEREWPDAPIEVYTDNNISAWGKPKDRPGYARLVADIEAGKVRQIVCGEQSRLTRRNPELEEFLDIVEAAGIRNILALDGTIDVVNRLSTMIKGVINSEEVRTLRRRTTAHHKELTADGRPSGAKPYGYEWAKDKATGWQNLVIIEDQAIELRGMADKVIKGWSIASIVRDLNGRGVPSPRGGKWSTQTITRLLLSPMIAGFRGQSRNPEAKDKRQVVVCKGTWAPILDETTWRLVTNILTNPAVVRGPKGDSTVTRQKRPGRRYLLTSGIATCGKCGAPLIGGQSSQRQRPEYACHKAHGGCNGLGIGAERAEAHFLAVLFHALDGNHNFLGDVVDTDVVAERDRLMDQLRVLDQDRLALSEAFGKGLVRMDEWQSAKAGLIAREEQLNAGIDALPVQSMEVDTAGLRDVWAELTLDEQRSALSKLGIRVVILAAVKGCYWPEDRTKVFDRFGHELPAP